MSKKILLIQLRRIGDVLMTTPSIRSLRLAFPDAFIAFLAEPGPSQVLKDNPHLDQVIVYKKSNSIFSYLKFLWELRSQHFDIVIDFFGNPRSAQMSWMTRASMRIGYNFRGRKIYYTHQVDMGAEEQYAAKHKSLLLEPLEVNSDSLKLDYFINKEDRQYVEDLFEQMGLEEKDFVVSLSPVSRQPYKVWPPKNFAQIADYLIERFNCKILFIYGPGEEKFVEDVRQYMRKEALPDYDVPTLGQTRAIFEKVRLHIGNDNGPCHFAIAAGTPTVAVFGKPKAINWTPPHQQRHQAVEYNPGCKNECTYPQCNHLDCINGVPVKDVQDTVLTLINQLQLDKNHVSSK